MIPSCRPSDHTSSWPAAAWSRCTSPRSGSPTTAWTSWPARPGHACAPTRLAALAADPDAPPFFGRLDREPEHPGGAGRDLPPRPPARPRPGRRPGRARLAGADRHAPFYRATPDGPDGSAAPAPVRLPRRRTVAPTRTSISTTARRWACLGSAARGDRASPRRADARHRRHHPARPGPPRARRPRHLALRPGRAGHRQDRGRAAPRRLPALHLPRPAAPLRRARRRPERAPSCTTSSRCCPRSARTASRSRPSSGLLATEPRRRGAAPLSPSSRATPGGRTCCDARSSPRRQADRGRRRHRRHQALSRHRS